MGGYHFCFFSCHDYITHILLIVKRIHSWLRVNRAQALCHKPEYCNRLFNEANNEFKILIANPKKGGEGISLHHECSNTIYIDRSYDAGKYLQSRDRIHRVGSKFENVNFYFFESIHPNKNNLIDKSISDNLSGKLLRFSEMFSDPDIFKLYEFEEIEDSEVDIGMTMSDIDKYLNGIENNELF